MTSASEPITELLKTFFNKESFTILNGYESDIFKKLDYEQSRANFKISILGSIYPVQDIEVFIKGFICFYEKYNINNNIQLNFIGVKAIERKYKEIKGLLPVSKDIIYTDFIDRKEVLKIGKESHILVYFGWKGFKGIYSAKIFEYIGLRRKILITPTDNDVIENLVHKTNTGLCTDVIDEVASYLEDNYLSFLEGNVIIPDSKKEVIEEYSREYQSNKLVNLIDDYFKNN